jgi:hypothetical protein
VAVDADLGPAVDSVGHEISPFDKLLVDYLVEAGLFVPGRLVVPDVFASAELAKVFRCFRADVREQLEGNST